MISRSNLLTYAHPFIKMPVFLHRKTADYQIFKQNMKWNVGMPNVFSIHFSWIDGYVANQSHSV